MTSPIGKVVEVASYIPGPNVVIGSVKMALGALGMAINAVKIVAATIMRMYGEIYYPLDNHFNGRVLDQMTFSKGVFKSYKDYFVDGFITSLPLVKPAILASELMFSYRLSEVIGKSL